MARQRIDVLLVRKDAPVQTMRLGPWLLYFFLLVLIVILAALAGGGYLLYQQNQALTEIVKDNRRLRLSAQNLETIVRDLQDRAFLPKAPGEALPPPPPPPPPREQPAPPPRPEPQAAPAAPEQPAKDEANGKENGTAAPQEAEGVEPWPTSSDWVEVRKVSIKKSGRDLLVYFEIANKLDAKQQAEGYATVLLRGQRKEAPWVEAWPPARLTPLGRPEDPKKAAHFSVQRYKRFKARFALVDKQVEAIEFLIFTEQGELALLVREDLDSDRNNS